MMIESWPGWGSHEKLHCHLTGGGTIRRWPCTVLIYWIDSSRNDVFVNTTFGRKTSVTKTISAGRRFVKRTRRVFFF